MFKVKRLSGRLNLRGTVLQHAIFHHGGILANALF